MGSTAIELAREEHPDLGLPTNFSGLFGSNFIEILDCPIRPPLPTTAKSAIKSKPLQAGPHPPALSSSTSSTDSSDGDKDESEAITNTSSSSNESGNYRRPGLSSFVRQLSGSLKVKTRLRPTVSARLGVRNVAAGEQSHVQPLSPTLAIPELAKQTSDSAVTSFDRQLRKCRSIKCLLPTGRTLAPKPQKQSSLPPLSSPRPPISQSRSQDDSMTQYPKLSFIIPRYDPASATSVMAQASTAGAGSPCDTPIQPRLQRPRKPRTPYPSVCVRPKIERCQSTTQLFQGLEWRDPSRPEPTTNTSFEVLNRSSFRLRSVQSDSLPMVQSTPVHSPDAYRLTFQHFGTGPRNYKPDPSFDDREADGDDEDDEADSSHERSRQLDPVWWT